MLRPGGEKGRSAELGVDSIPQVKDSNGTLARTPYCSDRITVSSLSSLILAFFR